MPFEGPQPELTVAAVVERDGCYLFVEELIDGRLVLNQPAGHVEAGESPAAAVVREVIEETGWTFVADAVIGVYLWAPGAGRAPFLRIAFTGRCLAHRPERPLDAGIERALWLTRAELMASRSQWRSPMVPRALDDYARGVRQPVSPYHDAGVDLGRLALQAIIV